MSTNANNGLLFKFNVLNVVMIFLFDFFRGKVVRFNHGLKKPNWIKSYGEIDKITFEIGKEKPKDKDCSNLEVVVKYEGYIVAVINCIKFYENKKQNYQRLRITDIRYLQDIEEIGIVNPKFQTVPISRFNYPLLSIKFKYI